MTKQQINQIMEFVQQNAENGKSFVIAIMDHQGLVRATFNGNCIEMSFMEKVLDNAIRKMIDQPIANANPTPPPPTLVPAS